MLSIVKLFLGFIAALIFVPLMYIAGDNNKKYRRVLAHILLRILGVCIETQGTYDEHAKLYILNHQSMLDIIALESLRPEYFCWVAKKELFELFLIGHLFKAARLIRLDRENKQGLLKLLKDAKAAIAANRPLMVFPEGTRSKSESLLPFKPGAKLLAEKLHLRVQPIVIVDSKRFLDTKFAKKLSRGTLRIIFLDSVEPNGETWLENTRTRMQEALNAARLKVDDTI